MDGFCSVWVGVKGGNLHRLGGRTERCSYSPLLDGVSLVRLMLIRACGMVQDGTATALNSSGNFDHSADRSTHPWQAIFGYIEMCFNRKRLHS